MPRESSCLRRIAPQALSSCWRLLTATSLLDPAAGLVQLLLVLLLQPGAPRSPLDRELSPRTALLAAQQVLPSSSRRRSRNQLPPSSSCSHSQLSQLSTAMSRLVAALSLRAPGSPASSTSSDSRSDSSSVVSKPRLVRQLFLLCFHLLTRSTTGQDPSRSHPRPRGQLLPLRRSNPRGARVRRIPPSR